eukprot:jgi/Tetstr1/464317/TSEL_009119.t1
MLVNRFERVEVQLAAVTAGKRPASPPDETPSLAKHSRNEMPAGRNDDASGSRRGRRNVKDTASGRAMLDGMARVMVRLRMLYGARTAIESGLGQPGAELP